MFNHVRSSLLGALVCASSLTSLNVTANDFTVEVTNLTSGVYFTPLLVTAHPEGTALFTVGETASASLQEMAEGGSIASLETLVDGIGASTVSNPAGGPLGPGETAAADLNTDANPSNTQLSVVAMVLPSNDGFIGLNAITIPTEPGTYTYNVNAYDAGTEANNEIVDANGGNLGTPGMPGPPFLAATIGANGTGINNNIEGFVHIHRNVLGDTDQTGGTSDIDSTVHRWLNPVARVVITVN